MRTTRIAGTTTSRLGLGCGRLVGGASMRSSRAIVETALALGITHFDTAPSYGLGTADDVLGAVLAGNADVTVVTKVGQQRPPSPGLRTLARAMLRPMLQWTPALKARLASRAGAGVARSQFTAQSIEASFADSLARLRRDHVTALLLHEIRASELSDDTIAAMEGLLRAGKAQAIGSGTGEALAGLMPFGTIEQVRWDPADTSESCTTTIMHGVMRHFAQPHRYDDHQRALLASLGRDPADPSAWIGTSLTLALAGQRNTIVLVSSANPARLRQAAGAIDWDMVDERPPQALDTMRVLLKTRPS